MKGCGNDLLYLLVKRQYKQSKSIGIDDAVVAEIKGREQKQNVMSGSNTKNKHTIDDFLGDKVLGVEHLYS